MNKNFIYKNGKSFSVPTIGVVRIYEEEHIEKDTCLNSGLGGG